MAINFTYADNTNVPIPTNTCNQTPAAYNTDCSPTMQTNFFRYYYNHAFTESNLSTSDYTNNRNTGQHIYEKNTFTASNPKFIIKPLTSKSDKKKVNTTIKWF